MLDMQFRLRPGKEQLAELFEMIAGNGPHESPLHICRRVTLRLSPAENQRDD